MWIFTSLEVFTYLMRLTLIFLTAELRAAAESRKEKESKNDCCEPMLSDDSSPNEIDVDDCKSSISSGSYGEERTNQLLNDYPETGGSSRSPDQEHQCIVNGSTADNSDERMDCSSKEEEIATQEDPSSILTDSSSTDISDAVISGSSSSTSTDPFDSLVTLAKADLLKEASPHVARDDHLRTNGKHDVSKVNLRIKRRHDS